jgi:hypothetical protein
MIKGSKVLREDDL